MLLPTKEKVLQKIGELMTEFELIDDRVRIYEEQHRATGGIFGPALELAEMRAVHDDVYVTLADAKVGVRTGDVPFKEIAVQLPALEKAVRHFKRVLDQTDSAAGAGRAAFKARYSK